MAVGEGCGKILLFGEHAAVYGRPAVGIALPLTIRVRIEESRARGLGFIDFEPDDEAVFRELARYLHDSDLPFEFPESCTVAVESAVPRSAGLGSSAALCTAIVRSLNSSLPVDTINLWRWANKLEAYFHGTASGIDTGLAFAEGVLAFYPSPHEVPAITRLEPFRFAIVIGTVARSGTTMQHVQRLRELMESGDAATVAAIDRLGELSQLAIDLFESTHPGGSGAASMGRLADLAHTELQKLGLSVEPLEDLLATGRSVGSLGGKLSGAGGGGAFFLIFEDHDAATRAESLLTQRIESLRMPARICGAFSVSRSGVDKLHR